MIVFTVDTVFLFCYHGVIVKVVTVLKLTVIVLYTLLYSASFHDDMFVIVIVLA